MEIVADEDNIWKFVMPTNIICLIVSDATGKLESGILEGNSFFEGDYRECIRVRENELDPEAIQGLYCGSVWLSNLVCIKNTVSLQWYHKAIVLYCNNSII